MFKILVDIKFNSMIYGIINSILNFIDIMINVTRKVKIKYQNWCFINQSIKALELGECYLFALYGNSILFFFFKMLNLSCWLMFLTKQFTKMDDKSFYDFSGYNKKISAWVVVKTAQQDKKW